MDRCHVTSAVAMELVVFRTQPSSAWPLPAVLSGHVRLVPRRGQTFRWEGGTGHKRWQENVYKYDNYRVSVGLLRRVWNVIMEARSVVEKNFQRSDWAASAAAGRVTMWTLSACLQVTLKNPGPPHIIYFRSPVSYYNNPRALRLSSSCWPGVWDKQCKLLQLMPSLLWGRERGCLQGQNSQQQTTKVTTLKCSGRVPLSRLLLYWALWACVWSWWEDVRQ